MVVIPNEILNLDTGLTDNCILLGYRGSVAHGMKIENTNPNCIDDIDFLSVCVMSPDYYLGLKTYGSDGTKEIKKDEYDIVIYEIKKMIRLLSQGNPNVLSMLWLKPNHYVKLTEAGKLLITNRDLFVGKHVYNSFAGYANGQLKRMTHMAYNGYMGTKRKELVDKFGFDTKNAAHLIRLLRMCIEFLGDGELRVYRTDKDELLDIKKGNWSLEKIQKHSDELFTLAREAYVRSTLPAKPDMLQINRLCVDIIREAW